MELIELCLPQGVDDGIGERARAWCEAMGKTVVEVPDEPGFVVNRLLFPYLFDAVRLLEQTGMKPEEVDRCMTLGAAYPMGPLALLDLVGLDVATAIGEALHADSEEEHHRPPGRLTTLIGEGKLGRKSGAGFYTYEKR
jgi:3-hydroxyacyl-CoA dehydrogenase